MLGELAANRLRDRQARQDGHRRQGQRAQRTREIAPDLAEALMRSRLANRRTNPIAGQVLPHLPSNSWLEPRRAPRNTCAEQDAIDDAAGDATFFVNDSSQIVTRLGRDPRRYASIGRRRSRVMLERRIAVHEAGHAVVALHEGLTLRHARIEPPREALLDLKPYPRGDIWPVVHAHARFYLAGYVAERRFAPDDTKLENSAEDFKAAHAVLGNACLRRDEPLELLRAQTDLIIALNWHQVERVARALIERGILSGGEISEIVDLRLGI
jgi:hypothetical protein